MKAPYLTPPKNSTLYNLLKIKSGKKKTTHLLEAKTYHYQKTNKKVQKHIKKNY